jgi:hypothetical protein
VKRWRAGGSSLASAGKIYCKGEQTNSGRHAATDLCRTTVVFDAINVSLFLKSSAAGDSCRRRLHRHAYLGQAVALFDLSLQLGRPSSES